MCPNDNYELDIITTNGDAICALITGMKQRLLEETGIPYVLSNLKSRWECYYLRSECIYAVPTMTSPVLKGRG